MLYQDVQFSYREWTWETLKAGKKDFLQHILLSLTKFVKFSSTFESNVEKSSTPHSMQNSVLYKDTDFSYREWTSKTTRKKISFHTLHYHWRSLSSWFSPWNPMQHNTQDIIRCIIRGSTTMRTSLRASGFLEDEKIFYVINDNDVVHICCFFRCWEVDNLCERWFLLWDIDFFLFETILSVLSERIFMWKSGGGGGNVMQKLQNLFVVDTWEWGWESR